ncbi:uncharacterized protein LOC110024116 isoform X2 [Phalaenopsis equestris]|uniref:uncharacterized protein LOC110024116 isoform X2 n=1 Tax=Phalaenopsis equestris TaxID=78828 RepID=UPI0009E299EA|nr:uncharacterized protein LOC110024116 isoform X2 [Phalaenopsis equestris]
MSPVMLDFRSPVSSSSHKVQSNRYTSQRFVTGCIPSPPSHHIFKSGGIPDPSSSMDRSNLGQGVSATTEKLSVPRFRKQRKRLGISRASPANPASDGGAGIGQSRSKTLYAVPFDLGEDSGTQCVLERLYGWKPFVSDASNCSSSGTGVVFSAGSSGSNASSSSIGVGSGKGAAFDVCDGGRGDIGEGNFVFGRGMEKVASWSSSSSQSSCTKNLGNDDSAKLKSSETGIPVGGSSCSLVEDNMFSDKGVFVFGVSGRNDGNLYNGSSLGLENDATFKLNSSKNVDEKSGKPESGMFAHWNGEKKSIHPSKNSYFIPGDGLCSEQPDRARKKDQENSGNVDSRKADSGVDVFGRFAETKVNLDQNSTMCSNGSSFFSVSKLPEDLMKLKIDSSENGENGNKNSSVFVFGSGANNSSRASKSSSFNFLDSTLSKLPQKMEKLNLDSSVGVSRGDYDAGAESSLKKQTQFSQTSPSGNNVGGSMFPGELKKQNLHSSDIGELGNDDNGVFVFGRGMRKNANSGNLSFQSFEESSISKLPDEMKNMKLNNLANEDDSQKNNPGNTWNNHDNNAAPNLSSRPSKEDYGSKVTPLQAHNSCGLNAEPTSFSSALPSFQNSMNHLYFTSMRAGSDMPMEFISQKLDSSLLTKESLFTKPQKNMTKEDSKNVRVKNKRSKARKSTPIHPSIAKQFGSVDKGLEENQEQDSTGADSPMDYSPYQETLVSNLCLDAHVETDKSIHFDSRCVSNDAQKSVFDINESFHEHEEADSCFRVPSERHFTSVDEMNSGLQKGNLEAINDNFDSVIQAKSSSIESESFSYDSSLKEPTYKGKFTLNSCSQDAGQSNFMFAATSVQGPSSVSKRNHRRKIKIKVPTDTKQEHKDIFDGAREENFNATKSKQDSAEETCEKWRLRGNQAYADGNLSKAEDFYSRGVDSFSFEEISKGCSRALMLCYSNRAATRMSLGRLREALDDCKMAITIDPSFLRARVRAGNIHLSLGETADALQHFEKVLQLDKEAKSDQKILLEAIDGIEKTQKLNNLMDQSSIFLTKWTPDDAAKVFEMVSEALSIAPQSEILLEMKAEALLKLRNYDEAIQVCEQTLEFAEKNSRVTETDSQSMDRNCSKSIKKSHARFWRWRIISKSYFYLGKLEEANELLQKLEKMKPDIDKYPEASTSFFVTVCELLRLKTAGNEAFQAGKHLEAVELYTAALTLNTESRPFTAICFCNRAAAYQALGQITDAIADCSLAIALDSTYKRAISRRATLHEMIRDYGQAVTDLQKLTSLLEVHSDDKNSASGSLGRSSSNFEDLNQARMRLSRVEDEARKGATLNMYMILGIESSCSTTDVRKAYRKAALRHHPDKAGQFLARSENGDDGVWREIAEEVHSDASRLFKMIGEAYAILIDPSKRQQYDIEEELRTMKKNYGSYGASSSTRTQASSNSSQQEKPFNSHHWNPYRSSYWRRSEG